MYRTVNQTILSYLRPRHSEAGVIEVKLCVHCLVKQFHFYLYS